jgi:L-rhamnose isomerase
MQVREEMGAPLDPIAAYRQSGYEAKVRQSRGKAATSGGYQ